MDIRETHNGEGGNGNGSDGGIDDGGDGDKVEMNETVAQHRDVHSSGEYDHSRDGVKNPGGTDNLHPSAGDGYSEDDHSKDSEKKSSDSDVKMSDIENENGSGGPKNRENVDADPKRNCDGNLEEV